MCRAAPVVGFACFKKRYSSRAPGKNTQKTKRTRAAKAAG